MTNEREGAACEDATDADEDGGREQKGITCHTSCRRRIKTADMREEDASTDPSLPPSLPARMSLPSCGRGQLDGKFAGRMQDAPPKNDLPFLTNHLVRNYIWLREREDEGGQFVTEAVHSDTFN